MSKKATRSRNQRLFWRWLRISKKQCHYRIEWDVEHNEYGIDVARGGSTPIGLGHQLHLQRGGKGTNQDAKKLGVQTWNPLQVMTQEAMRAWKNV